MHKVKNEKSSYVIQIVEHALDLLEQFHDDVDELGIAELSRRLKLHKNKVFRLLATLQSRHYIEQNTATENYRLGLKNLELGQAVIRHMGLIRLARPVQEALVRKCRETSYLATMKDFQIVYLDAVESDLFLRVVPTLGEKLPIYCTAAGKVLAASLNEEILQKYIRTSELKRFTPNTICDPAELANQLRSIADLGYAVDNEELNEGVKCVSAPIVDYTRQVVGAVSISGPSMRLTAERMDHELIPLVTKAAEEISFRLGGGQLVVPEKRGRRTRFH
ncbi:MAG: IclR family transcriptional regulator [Geobacter sp.]|nr:IclR family transcriptional regulator [Geobacter sp.]